MKKILTLIIVASLALTIQAQDITNTLGTDGGFYIAGPGQDTMFSIYYYEQDIRALFSSDLDIDGDVYINGDADIENLQIFKQLQVDDSAYIEFSLGVGDDLTVYGEVFIDSNLYIGDRLIVYDSAEISKTLGVGEDLYIGEKLLVEDSAYIELSLDVGEDLYIGGLYDGPGVTIGDRAVYVTSEGMLVVGEEIGTPNKSLNNKIQQLEEKNAALEAEMAELRKMVEGLMEEK